jgi:hypothetical protein
MKKSGLSIYKEPEKEITKSDYAMIVDESMMIGSQKMLLTLGVKAQQKGRTLSHEDVEILSMNVRRSWNGEAICSELGAIASRVHHHPSYVISDNATTLKKGIREFKSVHIKDISHTLGMLLERVYKNDKTFKAYTEEITNVKFKEIMNGTAYLLPPKQRTVARFMNLSQIVDWSNKMLINYSFLREEEQKTFSFIPQYASFIEELQTVITCLNAIEKEIKHNGLSKTSIKKCIEHIKRELHSDRERMKKLSESVMNYLMENISLLPSNKISWNASSDIIESIFGVYKDRKSPNPLHGVTPFVFLLPLYTRIGTKDSLSSFDFKKSLESIFMTDIYNWKKQKLSENMVYKRIKTLKVA